jgi:hypothetical protein
MNEKEFVSNFVEFCVANRLDPKEGLKILNAQDWSDDENLIPLKGFTIPDTGDE